MHTIGDIHIYVSDFEAALRFWAEGLQLQIAEQEVSRYAAYAQLDFPDGGPSLRLFGRTAPWDPEARPAPDAHPHIRFDITTSDLDGLLVRLIEHGGEQLGEIETFDGLRLVALADPDGNAFELLEVPE
ncbi:MAG: VOC family protein [Planctomycetes bacterium]|nr:VOC family protein [Planctomycetota bacterium]